jgi:hypothetical protein
MALALRAIKQIDDLCYPDRRYRNSRIDRTYPHMQQLMTASGAA